MVILVHSGLETVAKLDVISEASLDLAIAVASRHARSASDPGRSFDMRKKD
jgi:hypothetical protein